MGSTGSIPPEGGFDYEYYKLSVLRLALLPEGYGIVLNPTTGLLLLVAWQERRVIAEHHLEQTATRLISTLLSAWPSFVPHEQLLAALNNESVLAAEHHLDEARLEKTLDTVVETLRQQMQPVATCLATLGIELLPLQYGYHLKRKGER